MRTEGVRQSDRISLRLEVEASWFGSDGIAVKKPAESLLVSRNGGVIRLPEKLFPGQELTLLRTLEGDAVKSARVKIVAEIDREPEGFLYAVTILDPRADFWEIDFPPPHQAEEALARMLMECSFCQRREVVYLNEMEVVRNPALRGARLPPLRCAFHLDRGAIGRAGAGTPGGPRPRRGSCGSSAQSHARESARPGLHSPARLSGRSRRLRGSVQRRHQLPQPQQVSGRNAPGSRGPLYTGCGGDFCAHPHRLFTAHLVRRPVSPRGCLPSPARVRLPRCCLAAIFCFLAK